MGNLYLLNDFSTSMPWNLVALNTCKKFLAERDCVVWPDNALASNVLPTNFIFKFPANSDIPPSISQLTETILAILDSGKNVIVPNVCLQLESMRSQNLAIAARNGMDRHTVKSIFIIGRPVCAFEQRWRIAEYVESKQHIALTLRFANLNLLHADAARVFGSENTVLIPDFSDSPKARLQPELLRQIFAALGMPLPEENFNPPIPASNTIFGSKTARMLNGAISVGHNSWPLLDQDGYRGSLLALDDEWGDSSISPRPLRQMLAMEGRASQAAFEKAMKLEPGSLDSPDWLLKEPESSQDFQPDPAKIRYFISSLSKDVTHPLRQRLENDKAILSPLQRMELEILKEDDEQNFGEIGNPVEQPVLTVLTMTYNHEKYIAECMDSVLAQETDFPVRHLVLDHCSSDATPQIVAEYAAKYPSIQPVLLDRHVPNENARGLLSRCRSEYAALCDGDDYFLDSKKLQKQVDFLKKHPSCSLVFHPVMVTFEDGSAPMCFPSVKNLPRGLKEQYYLSDLTKCNIIQTNSVVYRWRFREGLPNWFRDDLCPGDWYWHLLHAEVGKVGFIPEIMAAYRRHSGALYVNSFTDHVEHRRNFGMMELEAYHVYNEHFKNRYFLNFANLASQVFTDFTIIAQKDNDTTLLDAAGASYPDFARYFLKSYREETTR